jgi:hypothetical protein
MLNFAVLRPNWPSLAGLNNFFQKSIADGRPCGLNSTTRSDAVQRRITNDNACSPSVILRARADARFTGLLVRPHVDTG